MKIKLHFQINLFFIEKTFWNKKLYNNNKKILKKRSMKVYYLKLYKIFVRSTLVKITRLMATLTSTAFEPGYVPKQFMLLSPTHHCGKIPVES